MVDIVTRLGKGSPLTNAEVDANFTNLAEVSGVTGEPMGHEDRTTSTISFNASTRTFTIAPVASSFTVWCKGKKVVVSTAQTVTIPNTTGMYSIYYDANGVLSAKSGYFTFSLEAPTAYVYWNAATGTAPYFGDERHGVVLDWQTHEYLHRTRGAALASGFSASGYVLGGNGSSNSHAQITLEGGTFFDEDMKIIVTATNTPTAGTWEQDLLSPARIPVLYLSGTGWVIDSPTDYPLKQGTSRPQYNAYSGGVWSTADVANNKYATSWILATNNLTYPVIAIIGQAENDLQSAAEAVDFTALQLPGFPSVEFRPLYKLIFQCADSCTNAVHASLVSITDIRSIAAAGTAASIVTDHGNLSGLSDDDHPQYIHVDTLRTVSAAVKASFLPSQTSNAGKFLQTDGTATSWQALTSGNVTTALGFTPYNATNPSGYISGITSGMVTTALGFTPYNATNPSGYVTAAGARGAISVTGAGSYDSATGVINIVGGVTSFNTRTGAITLSSADVTTALGFTPYNNTNPSGYITGITSTMVTTALGFTPYNSSNPNGYISSITSANVTTALGFTPYNATNPSGYITSSALSGYLTSASAASTYLPLSGGTVTGQLVIGAVGTANSPTLRLNTSSSGAFVHTQETFAANLTSGQHIISVIGKVGSTKNSGYIGYTWAGDASNSNYVTIGHWGNDDLLRVYGDGNVTVGTNTVLHAGNYSSYALPLSGGTITGQTSISTKLYVGGATVNSGYNGVYASSMVGAASGNKLIYLYNDGSTIKLDAYDYGGSGALSFTIGGNGGSVNVAGALTQSGNQVLHAANYSSYALPLSGGTLSGNLSISPGGSSLNLTGAASRISFRDADLSWTAYVGYIGNTGKVDFSGRNLEILSGWNGTISLLTGASGYNSGMVAIPWGNLTVQGNTVLHAGNYNSYSPTLTGGGASGTWGINVTGSAGSATNALRIVFNDGPRDLTDRLPNSFTRTVNFDFVGAGTGNGSGNYAGVMTFSPWTGTTASTGDSSYQLSFANTTGVNASGQPKLSIRNGIDSTWNAWYVLLHSGNVGSYALPISGGTVTGTLRLGDSSTGLYLSGGRLNVRSESTDNVAEYASYGLYLPKTGQAAGLYVESPIEARGGLRLGNSAGSGTITVGADTAATANRLVQRDSNGHITGNYILGSYFNSSAGNSENPTIGQVWTQSTGDNYLRKSTPAHFISQLGLLTTGNYSSYALPLSGGTVGDLRTNFTSGGGGHTFSANHYSMGKDIANGGWSDPHYSDLIIGYHTGIRIGAAYSGIRFYNNSPTTDANNDGNGDQGEALLMTVGGHAGGSDVIINNSLRLSNSNLKLGQGDGTALRVTTAYGWINFGAQNSSWTHVYSDKAFYTNQDWYVNGNVMLHAGNYTGYSHSIATSDSRYSRKDTTSQWIKPYYEYGSYLTSESPATLKDQMGGGGLRVDFMNPSYTGSGGWNHVITWSGYNMYNMYQLGGHYDGGTGTDLWVRSEANHGGTSWTAWRKLLNSSNYNSYSPTLTGGNASGTWGINISGNAASASSLASDTSSRFRVITFTGEGYDSGNGSQPTSYGIYQQGGGWSHPYPDLCIGFHTGIKIGAYYGYNGTRFYNNSDWATEIFSVGDGDNNVRVTNTLFVGGNTALHAGNYSSYAGGLSTGNNWTNYNYFVANRNTTSDSPPLQAFSNNGSGAIMSFHRGGYYAVNFGLDSDNVMRIGGWSAGANRWQLDMSGNMTVAGNVTAYSDERLKKDWAAPPADFVKRLAKIKAGTYTRIDSEERQAGVSAQDFQNLLPEAVSEDNEGTLSLAYGNAALVSAVELAKDNVELRARIERLESLINKLIGD